MKDQIKRKVAKNAPHKADGAQSASLQSERPEYLTLFEAAKALGLAESTLSKQIASGMVRRHKQGVMLSEVIADRAANLQRPGRKPGRKSQKPQPKTAEQKGMVPETRHGAKSASSKRERKAKSAHASFSASAAVDKDYAARLRKLEYEERAGKLMDRELAERVFFETARDIRDAWLTWPARVSTLLAAELGIDARTLNTKLVEYVNQHLTELGTPDAGRIRRPIH